MLKRFAKTREKQEKKKRTSFRALTAAGGLSYRLVPMPMAANV